MNNLTPVTLVRFGMPEDLPEDAEHNRQCSETPIIAAPIPRRLTALFSCQRFMGANSVVFLITSWYIQTEHDHCWVIWRSIA